jgi:hypothetical protein
MAIVGRHGADNSNSTLIVRRGEASSSKVPLPLEWKDCNHGGVVIKTSVDKGIKYLRSADLQHLWFDQTRDWCAVVYCKATVAIIVCTGVGLCSFFFFFFSFFPLFLCASLLLCQY